MVGDFAHRYPNVNRFIFERDWIEIGADEYSRSLIRALDLGGLIWEGKAVYASLDEALTDLECGLAQRMKEMTVDE